MRTCFISLIICLSVLRADPGISIISERNIANIFRQDFTPNLIAVSSTDKIYLLDQQSRQLAVLNAANEIEYTGGFGQGGDSFFDPVDLAVNKLEVIVCDRSEQRWLRYDLQLNYFSETAIKAIDTPEIYPEILVTDPWGAVLIYSRSADMIMRSPNSSSSPQPFIDLSNQINPLSCVQDMAVSAAGESALLFDCVQQIRIFNRFGRHSRTYPVSVDDPVFIVSVEQKWLVMNNEGGTQFYDQSGSYPPGQLVFNEAEKLLHIFSHKNLLYLLFHDRILIARVELD